MIVEISSEVLAGIATEAAASPGGEVCGLLFGTAERITARVSCTNVAADPATRFEIDPVALIAAYRAERGGGARVVGCYHSHPGGSAEPSRRDAADAAANGWVWVIAGAEEVRAWRAVEGGAWYGRFDGVEVLPSLSSR